MQHGKTSKLTLSVHAGSAGDTLYNGVTSPIFPASAYDYEGVSESRYPRYFNTPNQRAVVEKLAALEHAEDGVVFSSGMAAIMTGLLAMLKAGDHAIFQSDLYGGTHHAVVTDLPRFNIDLTMVDGSEPANFEKAIRPNTRLIYIETPSNPTLKITNISAVVEIAKRRGIITMIDNTFASPVNQNPIDFGVDIVAHSGTKYIGGHSDICCGAILASRTLAEKIRHSAINLGGSLDAQTCWLVERSLKTIVLRVRQQNNNAMEIADYLNSHPRIGKVYYPGLPGHPSHDIAREQMTGGFGGMLSFEVKSHQDKFLNKLQLIKRAISLGGVESTIMSPAKTSHSKMSNEERVAINVTDELLRLSVGIEDSRDLIHDLDQALA